MFHSIPCYCYNDQEARKGHKTCNKIYSHTAISPSCSRWTPPLWLLIVDCQSSISSSVVFCPHLTMGLALSGWTLYTNTPKNLSLLNATKKLSLLEKNFCNLVKKFNVLVYTILLHYMCQINEFSWKIFYSGE